jgi:hypothetical protein
MLEALDGNAIGGLLIDVFGADMTAAKRLESLNLDLARQTYLDAWHAAMFAGHLAGAGDLLEVSRAARALPAPGSAARGAVPNSPAPTCCTANGCAGSGAAATPVTSSVPPSRCST